MQSSPQKKILYIEDDGESRELMKDILNLHGYTFIGAARGLEGIRLATKKKPDLILIDINLPDIQGYEVTTILKSQRNLAHVPIIALTAEIDEGARERTIIAGCDGYISKPINVTDFVLRIQEYFEGRKDSVSPETEKKYLSEYNIRLVEKLQNKLEELEKVNHNLSQINDELNTSKDQLTEYNNRLFYMNNLANYLRVQNSPDDLLRILPHKIIEGFDIDRCIVFEYNDENDNLKSLYNAGVAGINVEKMKFKLNQEFYQHIKDDLKTLWVKSKDEIIDKSLLKIAQRLNSVSFILSSVSSMGASTESTGIFKALVKQSPKEIEESLAIKMPRKLLIFLDRGHSQKPFATYEIRILKAFLQSASIIYENMLLYHKLVKLYRIKEQEAITDPLTGTFNYRFFRTQIERELMRSSRHQKPFSIAMIDIDNFKQYNDTHGHINGDRILKLVANALVDHTRKSDIVARYGGDEFIIIFPELGKDKARIIAEKLCQTIQETNFPRSKSYPEINLTISLGVSTFPDDGKEEKLLVQKADEALYQAKESGRNTVCICA